jgi:hypothetical protein
MLSIEIRPCVKCGGTERYARGDCKACVKVASAAWQAANPDKVKASKRKYAAANREKGAIASAAWSSANRDRRRATNRDWAAANRERQRAHSRTWASNNKEARRINEQNRRGRKAEVGGKISKDLPAKLFALQKGRCACCKAPLGDDYHLDHIMPLALGGSNTDDNMQLLRPVCNMQKHAMHPVDFMQRRGLLL